MCVCARCQVCYVRHVHKSPWPGTVRNHLGPASGWFGFHCVRSKKHWKPNPIACIQARLARTNKALQWNLALEIWHSNCSCWELASGSGRFRWSPRPGATRRFLVVLLPSGWTCIPAFQSLPHVFPVQKRSEGGPTSFELDPEATSASRQVLQPRLKLFRPGSYYICSLRR